MEKLDIGQTKRVSDDQDHVATGPATNVSATQPIRPFRNFLQWSSKTVNESRVEADPEAYLTPAEVKAKRIALGKLLLKLFDLLDALGEEIDPRLLLMLEEGLAPAQGIMDAIEETRRSILEEENGQSA